jgi:hypothetical protein
MRRPNAVTLTESSLTFDGETGQPILRAMTIYAVRASDAEKERLRV